MPPDPVPEVAESSASPLKMPGPIILSLAEEASLAEDVAGFFAPYCPPPTTGWRLLLKELELLAAPVTSTTPAVLQ
jgi:hypothetical protein